MSDLRFAHLLGCFSILIVERVVTDMRGTARLRGGVLTILYGILAAEEFWGSTLIFGSAVIIYSFIFLDFFELANTSKYCTTPCGYPDLPDR